MPESLFFNKMCFPVNFAKFLRTPLQNTSGRLLQKKRKTVLFTLNHCLAILVCSEETQRKILESDIFRIPESKGVTEIGPLYKFSPSKFILVFGSKTAKEKIQGTEIQCRFGDSEICLNLRKRIGPLRNGRKPIFVTILLPEFISNQVVRLALSSFREVVSVFKGRHEYNRKIRNGKRHVEIFSAGGDPAILPTKISFHGRIQGDLLFAGKEVFCYR